MYTYIIESQGLYKIGKAKEMESRLKHYDTHNPQYVLLKVYHGDYERWFHVKYMSKWIRNEWFQLDEIEAHEVCNAVFPNGVREISYIQTPKNAIWSDEELQHNRKMQDIQHQNSKILNNTIKNKTNKRGHRNKRIGTFELERRAKKITKELI